MIVFHVPNRLTSTVSRKTCGVISSHGAMMQMPALATTTSSLPSAPTAASVVDLSVARSRVSKSSSRVARTPGSHR